MLVVLLMTASCSVMPPVAKRESVVAPQVLKQGETQMPVRRLTAEERAGVEARFRLAAMESAQTTVSLSDDEDQDTEPAVTAINISGVDHTAVAFIKITPTATPFRALIHTSSTTNLNSFPVPAPLPIPASAIPGVTYQNSADPYLAINYVNEGQGPLRTYCGGLAYNMNSAGQHPNGGVVVWRSDDGGSTWSGSSIVAEISGAHTYDKPTIAVSWQTGSFDGHGPSVGNVYVAWVDVTSVNDRILFSRSLDGGLTWSAPLTIATGYVHTPQIVVPGNTGRVFVLYARYDSSNTRVNSIEMVRSLDLGVTFSALPTLSNTRMLGPGTDQLHGNRARSVFQARYNPAIGLQVVWHGEDEGTPATRSDIYYASYDGAWTSRNLTPAAPGDQWNPAFDFDNAHNAVITWLDRRNDPQNNLLYQPFFMKINSSGATLQAPAPLSATASDPSQYTLSPSVGEYLDSWFFNYPTGGKWVSVWPQVKGASWGDIQATQIIPGGTPSSMVLSAQTNPANTTSVNLSWTPANITVTGYDIYRGTNLANLQLIATTTATTATDTGLTSNTTFVYRVVAVGPGTILGSNNDVATTINWLTAPAVGTVVTAQQFIELRQGIDYVRAAAGLPTGVWAETIASGVVIRAAHMNEMRDKLEAALSALDAPPPVYQYADPVAGVSLIRYRDVKDLRDKVH